MIKTLFLSIMQVLYLSSTIIGFGLFLDYVSKKQMHLYMLRLDGQVLSPRVYRNSSSRIWASCFAVLFGHKIEDVKLLPIKNENGVFGYVSHSYNPANLYQVIGNFL